MALHSASKSIRCTIHKVYEGQYTHITSHRLFLVTHEYIQEESKKRDCIILLFPLLKSQRSMLRLSAFCDQPRNFYQPRCG